MTAALDRFVVSWRVFAWAFIAAAVFALTCRYPGYVHHDTSEIAMWSRLEWPLGHFSEHTGDGTWDVAMPGGRPPPMGMSIFMPQLLFGRGKRGPERTHTLRLPRRGQP